SQMQIKPSMLAAVRAGLQRAYYDSLEFLRTKVSETEKDLEQIKLAFYQCDETDEARFEEYLVKCNENFLSANNVLRRKNIKLEVVDAEVRIVALLNQLREAFSVDEGQIAFISEFWENIRSTLESMKILIDKFKTNVLERLRINCLSYNSAEVHLEVSTRYTEEISTYLSDIEKRLTDMQILLKSWDTGIHQDLFTHTQFTERILVACDLKAFPILRLFPDLTEKAEAVCIIARKWLERDEAYMFEINDYIRETRTMTKKRAEDLKFQKEKHKKIEKAVKAANILLHNNREKLEKIESDLNLLESTLNNYEKEKKCKHVQKQQKESMVDFLKITVSQTKRNYSLQMKRQKMLKQVQDLEALLHELEQHLVECQSEIMEKSQMKEELAEKVEATEKTYGTLKSDLDKFSLNLHVLEQEVSELSGQLLQLEIIQTFKTSPEQMDGIYDRPQSVKLAPSLKEKIKRKRKVTAQVH
ncbi:hypothetical protein CHS0354_012618, partial [Potamilus streckersoni]